MAQDFYDPLQPFDFMVTMLDDRKAELGIRYIAENDEQLRPMYPAMSVAIGNLERMHHATGVFLVTFNIDMYIFHAELTAKKAVRSRKDIQLATDVRRLIHANRTMDGHLVEGWVDGEFPGVTARTLGGRVNTIVTTRLTWQGVNRVPYEAS